MKADRRHAQYQAPDRADTAGRLRVGEIDDDEVRRLLRIVRSARRGQQHAGLGESRCWLYREEDPALRHDLQAADRRLVDPDLPARDADAIVRRGP